MIMAELRAHYPKHPAVATRKVVGSANDRRNSYADLRDSRAKADLSVYKGVLEASVPPSGDYTFPKDWVDRIAKRSTAIKLTELEKTIVKALNTVLPEGFEYEGKTFKDVLDDLRERTKMPIVVDPQAMQDLNITYAATLNVKLGKVTTRTALKKIVAELGLVYVMKDQAIQITTPARAKEMLTTRVYSVADLVPVADLRFGPIITQLQAMDTIQRLVVLITQTVEPESWEVNGKGGLGTITFYPPTMSLVVKQTAEMHYLLGLSGR
jgi:hypothetical protein